MDDRRFEEIMAEYVGSNRQNKEKMLRKYRARQDEEATKKTGMPTWVTAVAICVLAIVLSLSVAVPLVLENKERGKQPASGVRFNLEYNLAYAGEYSGSLSDFGLKKVGSDFPMDIKYKFDSLDEYEIACQQRHLARLRTLGRFDEEFFQRRSLIVIFSYATEYSHCRLTGVSKLDDTLIVTVSKQREKVLYRAMECSLDGYEIDVPNLLRFYENMLGGKAFLYLIDVDKNKVNDVEKVDVEVDYSRDFIYIDDAKDAGIIDENDEYSIEYYFNEEFMKYIQSDVEHDASFYPENFVPAAKEPETLSEETMKEIEDAYVDSLYELSSVDWADGEINTFYLGTYNGYIATAAAIKLPSNFFLQVIVGIPEVMPSPIFLTKAEADNE